MSGYNGTLLEYIVRLSKAYDEPVVRFYQPKKEKGIFRMRQFSSTTPRHNETNRSFEDNEQHLKELDNEPIWQLMETGPVLTKKPTQQKGIYKK